MRNKGIFVKGARPQPVAAFSGVYFLRIEVAPQGQYGRIIPSRGSLKYMKVQRTLLCHVYYILSFVVIRILYAAGEKTDKENERLF